MAADFDEEGEGYLVVVYNIYDRCYKNNALFFLFIYLYYDVNTLSVYMKI